MARQSSNALSRLASRIMKGAEATRKEVMQLAASVLSQDETRGSRAATRRTATKRTATKRKTPARKRAAKKRK